MRIMRGWNWNSVCESLELGGDTNLEEEIVSVDDNAKDVIVKEDEESHDGPKSQDTNRDEAGGAGYNN